jgi:DNA-binding NarL/FixJ family response regulator
MGKSVIIYEDEPLLRTHLQKVFYTIREEFHLLDSFPDADDVLNHLNTYQPDVIIMDIQMKSDDDGIYALYKIKNANARTKVMMLTTFDTDDKVFNAICLGADGYMLKTDFSSYAFPQEAIKKSLNIIFDGGAYLTPSVAKQILNLFTNSSIGEMVDLVKRKFNTIFKNESTGKNVSAMLTEKQMVVLREISEGKTTTEIANALGISDNTVNTHIKAIYSILEVHSRARAIKKAIEYRLVRFTS